MNLKPPSTVKTSSFGKSGFFFFPLTGLGQTVNNLTSACVLPFGIGALKVLDLTFAEPGVFLSGPGFVNSALC